MKNRSERRHHEERVKDKFRRVARDFWYNLKWWSDKKRREYVEHAAVRRAHHPRHQCQICRLPHDELDKRHKFEAEKKAPFIEG